MQLISTILNAFCQNLILFFYEILKDIIYTSILDIVFLTNQNKILIELIFVSEKSPTSISRG